MIRKTWSRVHALSEPWHSTSTGQAAALALTLAAAAWAVFGLGVATGAATQPDAIPHAHLPMWLRLALWWVPVLACWATLLTRRWAALACGLLWIAPAVRICSYLWVWITEVVSGAPPGTGWYVAAIHVPLLGLVALIVLLTRICRDSGICR